MGKYGDVHKISDYIDHMSPFNFNTRGFVRKYVSYIAVDHTFLIHICGEKFAIFSIDELQYCYCCELGGANLEMGFFTANNLYYEFLIDKKNNPSKILHYLSKYISGFEDAKSDPTEQTIVLENYGSVEQSGVTINHKELILWKKEIASQNRKKIVSVNPISQIIWCRQFEFGGGDNMDFSTLELYLVTGKTLTITASKGSGFERKWMLFQLALQIKSKVPHLLYGPNDEYEKIFKKNPEELLKLSKQKI